MAYQKEQQRLEQQRWEKEYALQQQQLANERSYYQSLSNNSTSEGYSLSDGSSNSSGGKKLTNVKKWSPALSSKNANNWYYQNIDKLYASSGITETQLENIIKSGLNSGVINDSDVDKILNTFGL